jgi:TRAP-type transport system periplasmic protein
MNQKLNQEALWRKSLRGLQKNFRTKLKEIKMYTNRLFYVLMVVFLMTTACTPQATSAPVATLVPNQPITLRLAVADPQGRPSDPYVREFIEQVKTLSNGSITIEPIWDAAADTTPSSEPGVIKALKEGQYDLGLAGARAFDTQGITSFQALQAPFLITNDALSKAVATSEIATRMLDSMSSSGVVGLTLWPEDLRHPFSVVPDKQILSPEDFTGLNVRATPSDLTYALLEAFGASPMLTNSDYQAAESGLRQGFSLKGTPIATGNVVFFPKFQVLFAHGGAFEKLSNAQQNILHEAAIATQEKAIAEHPSEVEAATAWCADGRFIVMATDEQVAAFEAAAQPVFAKIEQDPFNSEMIAAVRELKANTQSSAGAGACAPGAETEGWSDGLLPNGTWTVEMSIEDIVGMGVLQSDAVGWAGVYTWTFQDGNAVLRAQADMHYECEATYGVVEYFVRITYSDSPSFPDVCNGIVEDVQWRLEEDGLHFHLIATQNAPFVEDKATYEAKPWQKIADQ